MKQRIEFIDLAKGICILLVVSWHIDTNNLFYFNPKIELFFSSFRMPLYFILSGLFISFNGGGKLFLQKKINKLIIPYFFFVFISNTIFWFGKDVLHGYENGWFENPFVWVSPLVLSYQEYSMELNNNPIWFLPALFNTYMLYFIIYKITKYNFVLKGILSFIIGGIGYSLSHYWGIYFPFYIDTAMTAVPFIYMGELIRKKSDILQVNKYDKYNWGVALLLFVILSFTSAKTTFGSNNYEANLFQLYFNGLIGTIAILLVCKNIKKVPVISFVGKYSIIVLGIHGPLIGPFKRIFSTLTPNLYISDALVFISIILFSLLAIRILITRIPWFVAQKDGFIFLGNRE